MTVGDSQGNVDTDEGSQSIKVLAVWDLRPVESTSEPGQSTSKPIHLRPGHGKRLRPAESSHSGRRRDLYLYSRALTGQTGIWNQAVKTALAWAKENQRLLGAGRDTAFCSLEEVKARYNTVFIYPKIGPRYFANVDARHLEDRFMSLSHYRNIFFQCPYVYDPDNSSGTALLCSGFMVSAAKVREKGGTLYIGICTDSKYSHAYHLRNLIETIAPENGYRFDGADDETIKKLLHFGYKHQANLKDIHNLIIDKHVTLIFTKIMDGIPPPPPPTHSAVDQLGERLGGLNLETKDQDTA
ncbi:hypothetical protein DFS34DRAFT_693366 [Phlyctochytrium arcticum]|nr:hypothetical protein DFS34DRAFT_693366 [Phlyctochytrium arcticum]